MKFALFECFLLIVSHVTCLQRLRDMTTGNVTMHFTCGFCELQLSKHIETKLDSYIKLLRTTKITVENMYQIHTQQPVDHRLDCCKLLPADLR